MTKTSTALVSLVAAVPAAFLALLTVNAFLSHADEMPGMLNVFTGLALLCAALTALMPVGILIFGGSAGVAKPKKPKKSKADKDEPVDEKIDDEDSLADSGELDSGELESEDDFSDDDLSAVSDEVDALEDSAELSVEDDEDAFMDAVSDEWDTSDDDVSDEFEFDDGLSDDELEFDFDEEEK